jgi:hypothetical protein
MQAVIVPLESAGLWPQRSFISTCEGLVDESKCVTRTQILMNRWLGLRLDAIGAVRSVCDLNLWRSPAKAAWLLAKKPHGPSRAVPPSHDGSTSTTTAEQAVQYQHEAMLLGRES